MTRRGALTLLAGAPAWPRNPPRFERTLLQPWRRHLDWSESHWRMLVEWLDALRVREVALQWTAWNGIDYSGLPLRMAGLMAAWRMKMWLGLGFDEEFWRWPIDGEVAGRLAAWRARSVEQARRLAWRREVMRVAAGPVSAPGGDLFRQMEAARGMTGGVLTAFAIPG